jgi:hypothetical protein
MDSGFRALERLTAELKSEEGPELDWARLETRLLEQIGEQRPAAPRVRGRAGAAIASLAAAVLLLLLGSWYFRSPHRPAASPQPVQVASGHADGERLSLGDWVESGDLPHSVEHPGRARWTLAPHSRARLVGTGDYLTVQLAAGSVMVKAEPRELPESFAVEVQQTRIATRGTVFSVELVGAQVRVAVRRGTVVVGPALTRGHTTGFLLTAPTAGTFSLDGAKSGQIDGSEPVRTGVLPSTSPRSSAGRPTPAVPSVAAPSEAARSSEPAAPGPSASAAPIVQATCEATAEKVIAAVNGCFAAHTPPRGDMLVSVTFDLTIRFGPNGAVSELAFEPPLVPAVERCSRDASAQLRAPVSDRGGVVRRSVTLHR